jgi:hypothetical protein
MDDPAGQPDQGLRDGRVCVTELRLGLAPLPVAGVSVDRSSLGWLPQKASLWSLTHRHPSAPFPLTGREPRRTLAGDSP